MPTQKRSVGSYAPFVQTIVRQIRFDNRQRPKIIVVVPQRHAIAQAYDGAAVGAKANRGGKVRGSPKLMAMIAEREAVDALAPDVNPEERVASVVVDDALANDVGGLEDNLSCHGSVTRNPF